MPSLTLEAGAHVGEAQEVEQGHEVVTSASEQEELGLFAQGNPLRKTLEGDTASNGETGERECHAQGEHGAGVRTVAVGELPEIDAPPSWTCIEWAR